MERITETVVFLEECVKRIQKALDDPKWEPKRSHVEANRDAMQAAAGTLKRMAAGRAALQQGGE